MLNIGERRIGNGVIWGHTQKTEVYHTTYYNHFERFDWDVKMLKSKDSVAKKKKNELQHI